MRKILSILLFIVTVGIGILYYKGHKEDFHLIDNVSVGAIILLSVLQIGSTLCNGLQLKVLTDHYKLNLNFLQCYGILRATRFANLWLPTVGGATVKALYLKRVHNLSYSSFIALSGITNIIRFMVNSMFAFILLLLIGRAAPVFLFGTAAFILIGTFFVFVLAHRVNMNRFPSLGHVGVVVQEWRKIQKDYRTVAKLMAINCIIFLISGAEIYILFRVFSVDLSVIISGIIATFTTLSGAIKLVPGNLGIKEAIIVVISRIEGVGVNEGLHAAALSRVIGIIWTLVLMPCFGNNLYAKNGIGDHRKNM